MIIYTLSATELEKVEKLNNISINVFAYEEPILTEGEEVDEEEEEEEDEEGTKPRTKPRAKRRRATFFPVFVSKNKTMPENTVNLLLLCDDDNQHYVLITSLSGLLNGMNGVSKHKRLTHYCYHCLHG
jgi:hypothetical protein